MSLPVRYWPRLTETAPFPVPEGDFLRCQLCGTVVDDRVKTSFWQECDTNDKPEPGRVVLVCDSPKCLKIIEEHPRLYIETRGLRGSEGGPGWWMLLCDNCDFRKGVSCSHPDLKANGGPGLAVKHDGWTGWVCGKGGCKSFGPTAYHCTGKLVKGVKP